MSVTEWHEQKTFQNNIFTKWGCGLEAWGASRKGWSESLRLQVAEAHPWKTTWNWDRNLVTGITSSIRDYYESIKPRLTPQVIHSGTIKINHSRRWSVKQINWCPFCFQLTTPLQLWELQEKDFAASIDCFIKHDLPLNIANTGHTDA